MSKVFAAVRSTVAAINRHDAESVANNFAPNGVQVTTAGERLEGRAMVAAYFSTMFTAFPDLTMTVKRTYQTGPNSGIAEYEWSGTHLGPLVQNGQSIPATGRSFTVALANSATLNDEGLVLSAVATGDSTAIPRQLGLVPPLTTAEQRLTVVRKLIQAANGGDVQGIMACYAPLAQYGDERSGRLGREEIQTLWESRFQGYPNLKVTELEIATEGPTVIARLEIEGVQSGTLPSGLSTGRTMKMEMLEFFEVGLAGIFQQRSYFDSGTIQRQLGLTGK